MAWKMQSKQVRWVPWGSERSPAAKIGGVNVHRDVLRLQQATFGATGFVERKIQEVTMLFLMASFLRSISPGDLFVAKSVSELVMVSREREVKCSHHIIIKHRDVA